MARRRKNPTPCPLCKKYDLIYTDQIICNVCMETYQKGKEWQNRTENLDNERIPITLGDRFEWDIDPDFKPDDRENSFRFEECILKITGEVPQYYVNYHKVEESGGLNFYKSPSQYHGLSITTTKTQALLIQALADHIAEMRMKAYAEGFRKGRGLLQGIADGSLSINDFNSEVEKVKR